MKRRKKAKSKRIYEVLELIESDTTIFSQRSYDGLTWIWK